jgi:hypothetical protein
MIWLAYALWFNRKPRVVAKGDDPEKLLSETRARFPTAGISVHKEKGSKPDPRRGAILAGVLPLMTKIEALEKVKAQRRANWSKAKWIRKMQTEGLTNYKRKAQ